MKLRNFLRLFAVASALLATVNPAVAQYWTQRIVPAENNQTANSVGEVWFLDSVACSADGTKIVAGASYGDGRVAGLYVSTNLGISWETANLPQNVWTTVACSGDGTKMVAGAAEFLTDPLNGEVLLNGVTLYTSSDSGVTWVPQGSAPVADPDYVDSWNSIASSTDGTKLVAAVNEYNKDNYGTTNDTGVAGGIYLSSDSGASWHTGGDCRTGPYG